LLCLSLSAMAAAPPGGEPEKPPARDLSSQEKICSTGPVGDATIAACTTIIKSGQFTGDALAVCYFDRGLNYAKSQPYPLAIADFDQAIQLKPDFANAYFVRGTVKQVMGQQAAGDADIAKAKALDPTLGN